MPLRARVIIVACLLFGLTLPGQGAQAPGQAPGVPGQAGPPAADQPAGAEQPTFRVKIDLVSSDVIVRSRRGQFVSDLTKDDFEVFEDDVKQQLASFVLVHGGRAYATELTPPPPPQEGIILPPPRPKSDAAGRIFVIVVDDLHLEFRDTGRVRALFKKVATQLIHDGDLFGIVSTGTSSISIDLTYDRKRLDEAANKITGGGLRPSEIIQQSSGPEGPEEVLYRAHVAFETTYQLLKNLSEVHNRRKAVILLSNGYDFDAFSASRMSGGSDSSPFLSSPGGSDPSMWGQRFANVQLSRELQELTREANRSNATLYTIDPRGLVGSPDLDEQVDPTEWNRFVQQSQDSLRVLAELTGGIAVVNSNDFDRALKRIDAETSDYYVLGYYSSNPDPTRRNRSIEIKVTRKAEDGSDYDVTYRKAYSLRAMPESAAAKP
jgi:VWFA-related protein